MVDRWVRDLAVGFAALWCVGAVVRIAAVAMVALPGDEALFARTLAVPVLLAAAGLVLLGPGRGLPDRLRLACGMAFLAAAIGAPFAGFAASRRAPLLILAALAGTAAAVTVRRWVAREGVAPGALRAAAACSAVLAILCLVEIPLVRPARIGSLGVASALPNLEFEQPEGWKPGYPRCVYRHNSLGFRDREHDPDARRPRRLLLIGDSYVWGDGIAELDGTLGEQMRRAFEEADAGQWDVFSDGVPGNGLYGYTTAAAAIAPSFDPQWIVIGYLSPSDLDRYDLQYLLEREPRGRIAGNLFANLNAFQAIHEVSLSLLWRTPADTAPFREMLVRLAADARAAGRTVVALDYSNSGFPGGWPEGIHAWCLPSRFVDRTDGRNWIGGYDTHPTAAMDAELARLLVASVLAGRPLPDFACPADAAGKGGGP